MELQKLSKCQLTLSGMDIDCVLQKYSSDLLVQAP